MPCIYIAQHTICVWTAASCAAFFGVGHAALCPPQSPRASCQCHVSSGACPPSAAKTSEMMSLDTMKPSGSDSLTNAASGSPQRAPPAPPAAAPAAAAASVPVAPGSGNARDEHSTTPAATCRRSAARTTAGVAGPKRCPSSRRSRPSAVRSRSMTVSSSTSSCRAGMRMRSLGWVGAKRGGRGGGRRPQGEDTGPKARTRDPRYCPHPATPSPLPAPCPDPDARGRPIHPPHTHTRTPTHKHNRHHTRHPPARRRPAPGTPPAGAPLAAPRWPPGPRSRPQLRLLRRPRPHLPRRSHPPPQQPKRPARSMRPAARPRPHTRASWRGG